MTKEEFAKATKGRTMYSSKTTFLSVDVNGHKVTEAFEERTINNSNPKIRKFYFIDDKMYSNSNKFFTALERI